MSFIKDIGIWFADLLSISDYDKKVMRKFRRMRRIYAKGGTINRLRAKRMENKLLEKYQLHIPCTVKIGKNFEIRHPDCIGFGPTTEIGDNCRVYPFFSAHAALKGDRELIKNRVRRHPKFGNDCILGAKATVIGNVTIGDDVVIGAGALVTKDVPSHSVVKGVNQIRPKRPDEIPDKYKQTE
jgi:serine acetyltransferase